MKSLKEILSNADDKVIDILAASMWSNYEADGEDGISWFLNADLKDCTEMLNVMFDIETPELLADALKIWRDGGSEEACLKAELRQLQAREAEIKARLKAIKAAK